jgi:hypothetical protein
VGLAGVGGVGNDLEPRIAREQRGNAAAKQRVIVDHQNPNPVA